MFMSKCCMMRKVVNNSFSCMGRVVDNFFHWMQRTLMVFWQILLTSMGRGGRREKGLGVVEGLWSCSWASSCL